MEDYWYSSIFHSELLNFHTVVEHKIILTLEKNFFSIYCAVLYQLVLLQQWMKKNLLDKTFCLSCEVFSVIFGYHCIEFSLVCALFFLFVEILPKEASQRTFANQTCCFESPWALVDGTNWLCDRRWHKGNRGMNNFIINGINWGEKLQNNDFHLYLDVFQCWTSRYW